MDVDRFNGDGPVTVVPCSGVEIVTTDRWVLRRRCSARASAIGAVSALALTLIASVQAPLRRDLPC